MGIEALKTTLQQANNTLKEILSLSQEISSAETPEEKRFFDSAIKSFLTQFKLINNSVPNLLEGITIGKVVKPIPVECDTSTLRVTTGLIVLNKRDRMKFIEELKISEDTLKKLRKRRKIKKEKKEDLYKKPNNYVVLASRVFSKQSFKLADSGFQQLKEGLKKANMSVLVSTYLSIMLFSTLIAFISSLVGSILLSLFNVTMVIGTPYPIFSFIGVGGLPLRLLKNIAISLFVPLVTFGIFYLYPITQAASIKKRIESELPFAVIHMSSIAGSGVEPSRMFKILALSAEYPVISKEFKKIINQVNLYGYDLITALHNISKSTPSEKLSGLFNGIGTNISGGGDLKNYLDKKAEEILLDYKLEMKRYSNIAETSMDIYIGVLVAAPLIFMVLLILMNVTGIGFGMGLQTMSYLVIGAIVVMNIFFLLFLQIRQPN